MPQPRAAWIGTVAILALVLTNLLPARAAAMGPIQVVNAADLSLPTADVPAGFTAHPEKEQQVTAAILGSTYGKRIRATLQRQGFFMGYHGWLDGANTPELPFVTYDMYAFGSSKGAQTALNTLSSLVQGLETARQDPGLPLNTVTWTDGTETFGPTNQAFAVSEVVFHQANVLVSVIAFNQGATSNAISEALVNATKVSVACNLFLKSRLAVSHQSVAVPLAPLTRLP